MKVLQKILIVISVLLLIAGIAFTFLAFDKKDNYYNSDFRSLNKNSYVGGDAYNYIINGTYFTGYLVLSSACYICGILLFSTALITHKMDSQNQLPEDSTPSVPTEYVPTEEVNQM